MALVQMKKQEAINELPDFRNVVLMVSGGIGRNISATGLMKDIKEKYHNKKIIVVCSHPDVWLYNPYVDRIYNFSNPLNLYDDYFDDSLILQGEPYLTYGYIRKVNHMIDGFAEVWGIDKDVQHMPIIHFLKKEINGAKSFLDKNVNEDYDKIVMFQWVGGGLASPQDCNCKQDDLETMFKIGQMKGFRRSLSIELAQSIVDFLKDSGFTVLVTQANGFPKLKDVVHTDIPLRTTLACLPHVKTFIGIDSFLQHASAITGKRGLVLWGGTSPTCLGYEHNVNYYIKDACPKGFCHRPNSYFLDNHEGYNWNCIYDEPCLDFELDDIESKFYETINEDNKVEEE